MLLQLTNMNINLRNESTLLKVRSYLLLPETSSTDHELCMFYFDIVFELKQLQYNHNTITVLITMITRGDLFER